MIKGYKDLTRRVKKLRAKILELNSESKDVGTLEKELSELLEKRSKGWFTVALVKKPSKTIKASSYTRVPQGGYLAPDGSIGTGFLDFAREKNLATGIYSIARTWQDKHGVKISKNGKTILRKNTLKSKPTGKYFQIILDSNNKKVIRKLRHYLSKSVKESFSVKSDKKYSL